MGSRDIDIQCGFWSSAFGFCYGNALYVLIILISLLLFYCICYRHWSSYICMGAGKFSFIFFVGKLWFSSLSLTCCCDFDSLLLPIYFCVVSYVFLSKAFYVVSCVCHLCAFVVSKDFMFCILLLWILIQCLYYCVLSCIYESCVVSFIFCV